MTWGELRLKQAAEVAAEHGCASAVDVESLVAEVEKLQAQVDNLQNCLQHARTVLEFFSKTLPDQEHRRWAHGGLIGSEINPRGGNVPLELPERLRRRENA